MRASRIELGGESRPFGQRGIDQRQSVATGPDDVRIAVVVGRDRGGVGGAEVRRIDDRACCVELREECATAGVGQRRHQRPNHRKIVGGGTSRDVRGAVPIDRDRVDLDPTVVVLAAETRTLKVRGVQRATGWCELCDERSPRADRRASSHVAGKVNESPGVDRGADLAAGSQRRREQEGRVASAGQRRRDRDADRRCTRESDNDRADAPSHPLQSTGRTASAGSRWSRSRARIGQMSDRTARIAPGRGTLPWP